MAFHIDCGAFRHVFDAEIRLVSVCDQIDIDDVFALFAGLRLIAAVDGHRHIADRGSVLLEGFALRFTGQITHEKDFVEVHHNWFAPVFRCVPCLYHNIINENFL